MLLHPLDCYFIPCHNNHTSSFLSQPDSSPIWGQEVHASTHRCPRPAAPYSLSHRGLDSPLLPDRWLLALPLCVPTHEYADPHRAKSVSTTHAPTVNMSNESPVATTNDGQLASVPPFRGEPPLGQTGTEPTSGGEGYDVNQTDSVIEPDS